MHTNCFLPETFYKRNFFGPSETGSGFFLVQLTTATSPVFWLIFFEGMVFPHHQWARSDGEVELNENRVFRCLTSSSSFRDGNKYGGIWRQSINFFKGCSLSYWVELRFIDAYFSFFAAWAIFRHIYFRSERTAMTSEALENISVHCFSKPVVKLQSACVESLTF